MQRYGIFLLDLQLYNVQLSHQTMLKVHTLFKMQLVCLFIPIEWFVYKCSITAGKCDNVVNVDVNDNVDLYDTDNYVGNADKYPEIKYDF